MYFLGVLLSGGGYIEKNHSDSVGALQAQMAELNTTVALAQQSQAFLAKNVERMDRDLRELTRSFDKGPQGRPVAVR